MIKPTKNRQLTCTATFVFAIFGWAAESYGQPEARRERLHSDYEHDFWDTRPKDLVRVFRAYTSSFDSEDDNDGDARGDFWGTPEWVSYELRRGRDRPEFEPRPSTWHTDRGLYQAGVAPRDQSYVNTGYDRGHLCMRQHARRSGQNADWNSHSMLNSIPQEHEFNAGHWLSLEKLCAVWANEYERIWVICGPINLARTGNRRPYEWIPESPTNEKRVAVPHKCFKIVVKQSDDPNRPDVLAFIYDNHPDLNDSSLTADHVPFLKPVDDIEEMTGLDFFASLSPNDQRAIENTAATELWPFDEAGDTPIEPFALHLDAAPRAAPNRSVLSPKAIDRLYQEEVEAERGAHPTVQQSIATPSVNRCVQAGSVTSCCAAARRRCGLIHRLRRR